MKRRRLESMNRLTERFNNGQAAVMGCGETANMIINIAETITRNVRR